MASRTIATFVPRGAKPASSTTWQTVAPTRRTTATPCREACARKDVRERRGRGAFCGLSAQQERERGGARGLSLAAAAAALAGARGVASAAAAAAAIGGRGRGSRAVLGRGVSSWSWALLAPATFTRPGRGPFQLS